jgi:glycosyltransferase involved in cell wall biosynthesis
VKIATLSNAAVIHTRRWVEYFRSRGHEVRLWSLESGPPALGAVRLPSLPLPGFLRYPLAVPALARALRAYRPDLVDAHFVPNYGLMGALSGFRPLAVTPWGSDLLVTGRADPLHAARVRFVLERADVIVADSGNLAAAARRLGGGERVSAIPWGIDLGFFRPAAERERGLLLSTRMHESIYDLPTLLHGVGPVLESRPETSLVVAGAGRLTGDLERLAERVLPRGRWHFVGRISPADLAGWLARAHVYLSASRSDSTSLSLLEAMAAGAVPVVSDLEGNRQWVSEGEGARMFPVGDPAAVTRAVLAVLDDPLWAEAARRRNRAVVERDADATVNMSRIESLFEESVSRGRRPA